LINGTVESGTPLKTGALVLIAAIYLQLFLGAIMRHTESGLAVYDFPTTAGQILPLVGEETLANINNWRFENTDSLGAILPDVTREQVFIHLGHRGGAVLVTAIVAALAFVAYRRRESHPALWRTALWLSATVAIQILLGAMTIWTVKQPYVTSVHVVTGAAVLGLATLLALRAWPLAAYEADSASDGTPASARTGLKTATS